MKRTSMTTRAEALKIAKYLGCSGAHETESGWMPCADHQTLMMISNRAEKSLEAVPNSKRRKRSKKRNNWEYLRELPVIAIDTLADGSLVSGSIATKAANIKCPEATQSIAVNLRNRQKAIKDAKYGPLNPNEPSREYWKNLADDWDVTTADAKKQRCGNCAAFVKTPEMLKCIQGGIGNDRDSWSVIEAGDLGYCEFFDFKCASKRTCRAWVVGGPIDGTEKKELSARTVRSTDPDVFSSPESARARSRQLGCIGIRRYSSDSGKPAWMPCTNESDYRRRMGTSEQGRIDIAKRQMRDMRLAIGKMRTKSAAKTPAPKKDQIFGSSVNSEGSASSASSASTIELSDKTIASLRRSITTHNQRMDELNKPSWSRANLDALKVIYRRGSGAFSTSHRPNVTRSQWAMGRVRAFLWMLEHGKPKKLSYITDNDMLPASHPFRRSAKSAEMLLSDINFTALEEKGLGKLFTRLRPNKLRKGKRIPKPLYDGDGDGKITNPLTGLDDLPFNPAELVQAPKPNAPGKWSLNTPPKRTVLSRLLGKPKERPSRRSILPFTKIELGSGSESPKQYPTKIFDPRTGLAWVRDEFAELLGDTWIRGEEVRDIRPVPQGIRMSTRQWNGLVASEMQTIEKLVKQKAFKGLTGPQPRTPKEWESFLNRRTHRMLDGLFPGIRERYLNGESISRDSFPDTNVDEIFDRIRKTGEIDYPDDNDFSYVRGLFSPLHQFALDARKFKLEQTRDNPNINHGNAPFLTDREYYHAVAVSAIRTLTELSNLRKRQGSDLSDGQVRGAITKTIENEAIFSTLWGPNETIWGEFGESVADLLGHGNGSTPEKLQEYLEDLQDEENSIDDMMMTLAMGFSADVARNLNVQEMFDDEPFKNPRNALYDDVLSPIEFPTEGLLPDGADETGIPWRDKNWRPYLSPISIATASDYQHLLEHEEHGSIDPGIEMPDHTKPQIPGMLEQYKRLFGDSIDFQGMYFPEDIQDIYGYDLTGPEILEEIFTTFREWVSAVMSNYSKVIKRPDDDLERAALPDIGNKKSVLMNGVHFMPDKLKQLLVPGWIRIDDNSSDYFPPILNSKLNMLYWEVAYEKGLIKE